MFLFVSAILRQCAVANERQRWSLINTPRKKLLRRKPRETKKTRKLICAGGEAINKFRVAGYLYRIRSLSGSGRVDMPTRPTQQRERWVKLTHNTLWLHVELLELTLLSVRVFYQPSGTVPWCIHLEFPLTRSQPNSTTLLLLSNWTLLQKNMDPTPIYLYSSLQQTTDCCRNESRSLIIFFYLYPSAGGFRRRKKNES